MGPRRVGWSCVFVVAVTLSGVARAGNDDTLLHGSDAAMTGGAITATTEDGAAVYYNPAGLANIERGQVNVSANAIVVQRLRVRDFLSTTRGDATDADVLVIPLIPAALTFAGRLSDDVGFGGGIFVSQQFAYTLRSSLDAIDPVPFNFTLAFEQREINTVPGFGIGWSALPNLRIGISVFGRYREQYGALVFGAGTTAPAPSSPSLSLSANSSFGSAGAGFEGRVGVQWDPMPELTLAATVWTPTFNVLTSTQETNTTSVAGDGGVVYVPDTVDETVWGFDQASSWRFRFGAAWTEHWGWLSIDGDVQPAFENPALGLRRVTTWALRAGAKLRVADGVAFGVGAFTDRSPQPQGSTNTFSPNIDLYGATVGLTFENSHVLGRDERARDIRFMTGLTFRFAYGEGEFGTFVFDPSALGGGDFIETASSPASLLEMALYISSGLYF